MRAALASAPRVAAGTCHAATQRYLARLPAIRAAERQIVGLLNAKHYQSAIPALRSAVTRYGDAWAGVTLGHLYDAGLGVRRSAKTAVRWYLWSAERGNRYAQRQLADAYLNGVGVGRSATRAGYWFRIGVAPYELARSDYWLAETYASGTLAPVNRLKERYYLDESLGILRKLAREPNGEADFDLGRAYAGGHGAARDRTQALRYFCRALALGYGPAAARIRKLEQRNR
ncbi:MAG: tetratricopeptide repeat protein [Steroidobacteraceae bacterium]